MQTQKDIKIHRKDRKRFKELEQSLSVKFNEVVPAYLTNKKIELGEESDLTLIEISAAGSCLLADLEFIKNGEPTCHQLLIPLV